MSDELFITHCTTCRARLKVYDQGAIGQILSCPKCGSMVQVVAPADWQPGVAATAALVAPPATARAALPLSTTPRATTPTAPVKSLPASLPKAKANSTPTKAAAGPTASIGAGLTKPAVSTLPTGKPAGLRVAAPIAAAVARAAPPSLPGAPSMVTPPPLAEQSLAAGRVSSIAARVRQDWWMLACGFLAGVLVGGVVWLVLVTGDVDNQAANVAAVAGAADLSVEPPIAESSATASHEPASELEQPATATAAESLENTRQQPAVTDNAAVQQPIGDPVESVAQELPPDDSGAGLLGGQLVAPAEDAPQADAPPQDDAADADSQKPADSQPTIENPPTEKPVAESDAEPAGSQQALAEERLAESLPSIDFKQAPLNQFVSFLSQWTTMPIKIDRASLEKAGKDIKTPVSMKRTGATVGQALREALAPHGLTYRIEKDTLIIMAAKRAGR